MTFGTTLVHQLHGKSAPVQVNAKYKTVKYVCFGNIKVISWIYV